MNQEKITKRCLTPQQVEEMYGIPVGTLANLRYLRRGPQHFKIGRKVLYLIEHVESWLLQNPVLTMDSLPDRS